MLVTRYLPICHSPADLLDPFHPEPFHLFSLTKFPFVIGSSRDRYILTMSAQTGYVIGVPCPLIPGGFYVSRGLSTRRWSLS